MIYEKRGGGIGGRELSEAVAEMIRPQLGKAKRVLLVPPDITRLHSRAGDITTMLYQSFTQAGAHCDLIIALGTHLPMTQDELAHMFPGVPYERCIAHDWRNDTITLGEIPSDFIRDISNGAVDYPIAVQINRRVIEGGYDAIYCIGQVVPHEVAGMSSYSKHMLVGLGGGEIINRSHFLGAAVGAENIMGRKDNPVRVVFDKAQADYLDALPLNYIMTVVGPEALPGHVNGLYFGRGEAFDAAARLSVELNINHLSKPIDTCVVYLDPSEYRSTWLGNKAVYRTRMALAKGARLIVLGGGIRIFGEDAQNNALIEKYGYCGRESILELVRTQQDLQGNLSVAAHLIHGSSDGAFSIHYAVSPDNIDPARLRAVGYQPLDLAEALALYPPDRLTEGFQTIGGEEIFFIRNPALGLWGYEGTTGE